MTFLFAVVLNAGRRENCVGNLADFDDLDLPCGFSGGVSCAWNRKGVVYRNLGVAKGVKPQRRCKFQSRI